MTSVELKNKLESNARMGLDMSPGDELSLFALEYILDLEKQVRELSKQKDGLAKEIIAIDAYHLCKNV